MVGPPFSAVAAWAHGISEVDKQRTLDGDYLQYIGLDAGHMLTGYNYLLFLFGVVFFLTKFTDVTKPVIALTSGHCIALIFTTFLKITWNFWPVGTLIVISVIYKGFDNNDGFQKHFSRSSSNLPCVISAFGLLCGFGLSTRLQQPSLGDDNLSVLMRILGSSVGIETE